MPKKTARQVEKQGWKINLPWRVSEDLKNWLISCEAVVAQEVGEFLARELSPGALLEAMLLEMRRQLDSHEITWTRILRGGEE